MLDNIYPAVRATQKSPGDRVSAAIDANAIMIAERLRKDPALAAHIKAGDLTILPARYILATGKVNILQTQ
jgi:carbonic anhydrase